MTLRLLSLLLLIPGFCLAQQQRQPTPLQTIKIKLEANQWDSTVVMKKLNQHGADHGLRFELADEGYDYRILFATGQETSALMAAMGAGAVNYSKADVVAFDAKGTELFRFRRGIRYTDSGAANAAAKEIVKRLLKVRETRRK